MKRSSSKNRCIEVPVFGRFRLSQLVFLSIVAIATSCNDDRPDRPVVEKKAKKTNLDEESKESDYPMSVQSEPAGTTEIGQEITQFILTNENGVRVTVINYGAIVTSIEVPDREGNFDNVVLGFDDLKGFQKNVPYFGAICGRYANRIAGAKFTIDGEEYQVTANLGVNHIHGGKRGLDKFLWSAEPFDASGAVGVRLNCESPDGDEGFPGKLNVTVAYSLTNDNEFRIEYSATSDKATPINLSNHCYWNLAGTSGEKSDILNHELTLNCDKFVSVDKDALPTGIAAVENSAMDFTKATAIGARIKEVGDGYDHCMVINGNNGRDLVAVAEVYDPKTGRVMEVSTTEPGAQFYTGNFLDGSDDCAGFAKHQGFCLECQHFPDSPNQPDFPNTILRPNQVYTQKTVHKFSTR